jgi:hypothetical protein
VDAVARTRALLDQHLPTEAVVQALRDEGYSPIISMSALIKASGMTYDDARTAVIESPVWADHRDKIATNQWIDPPATPDAPALERMREVCRTEPRIAEVWITGSRFTRSDGASEESTSIALVLDPPGVDPPDETETARQIDLFTKLRAAWPAGGLRSWMCVTHGILEAHGEHCLPVYSRGGATQ